MEDALDELIKDCAQQLFELTDDKENERYPLSLYVFKMFASRAHYVSGLAWRFNLHI
jgi:hypothetical protein